MLSNDRKDHSITIANQARRVTANLSLLLCRERPPLEGKPLHPSLARRHSTNRFLLKKKSPESQ